VRDFIELITVHPGALVYHLVTLFAIQIIAGVTFGHWQRQRDEPSTRLLVMAIGLFLARLVLMLIAVIDTIGLVSSVLVLPPLERFLHLITSLLVIWVFLPVLEQNPRLSTPLLLVTTLVAAGTYAAFASLWPGAEAQGVAYNSYWQESVWELSTTAILAMALVASLAWRGPDWGWLVCLLGLWLVGHILQFVTPTPTANAAGWVRLANLIALPLLAALVYRRALSASPPSAEDEEKPAQAAAGLLEAIQRIRIEDDLKSGLELSAPFIAEALNADMTAVGLMVPGPVDVLRVIALHPPTSVMAANQEPTLLLSKYPMLAAATRGKHMERAIEDRTLSLVEGLYRRLGFAESGPLLVEPLMAGEEVLALIVVGNPESQRAWETPDEQLLQAIAYVLASAVAGDEGQRAISEEQLAQAQKEARLAMRRAEDLKAELERQRRRSEELSTKLRLREEEAEDRQSSVALAVWQEEVRELAEARDALQAELSEWQKRAKRLGQTKDELEKQLQEMRSAGSPSDDGELGGILVSDEQGAVILASKNTHHLLERTRGDLMNATFQGLFEEPWWTRTVNRLLNGTHQTGDATTVSLKLGERTLRAELSRLPPSEHWPGTLVALLHLAEGTPVERAMVASLIQELRTPMTSITGYTDLLLSERAGILGESQRRFLLRVEANIERMERLLNDLIKATDVDAGQMTLSPEPVEIDQVVEEALDTLSARLAEKRLKVQRDVPSELPPVHADRDSLRQIVLNILSNAALASEPDTQIQLRARVEERPDDLEGLPAYLLVSVTDTGGGIAPEDRRRVFHRFYRADMPLIPGLGDTGVGLSMARALVEANDGRIWVESEMGAGSTFSFMLPLSPTDETREPQVAGGVGREQ
jgi:signal transduction histidine kinase/GAF domain-containing protein